MRKLLLACVTMLCTGLANAVPNVWTENFRQGYDAEISTTTNSKLHIGCYLSDIDNPKYHELKVTHNKRTIQNTATKAPLSFFINNKISLKPLLSSATYSDAMEWNELIETLPKSTKIEVYENNQLLFTLTPRNSEELEALTDCRLK